MGMAVSAMLKDEVQNKFSSWQSWFGNSHLPLPRATHFSVMPQSCVSPVHGAISVTWFAARTTTSSISTTRRVVAGEQDGK